MPRSTPTTELVTVLFTDIVSSTEIAEEVADRRWRALVAAHHGLVRRSLKRHRGRELDTAGDGFFASFPRPADAIRCAVEVAEGVREFGLEIRAGVHLGEAEIMGSKVGGLVVNTGARIMSLGTAGEVLVSATVREAVAGKGIGFTDHGVHQLKGIEGEHRVFVVSTLDEVPVQGPLDPAEARRRRQLPPPIPASRPRWIAVAAAAAAVALGVGGYLLSWGSDEPQTRPRETPAGRALGAADEQLLELVPEPLRSSCEAVETLSSDAVSGVACLDGERFVRYEGYPNEAALEAAFGVALAGVELRGSSCRDDRAASETYEVNGAVRGRVACFVEKELLSYHSTLVWEDTDSLVLATATEDTSTEFEGDVPDLSLHEWWRTVPGPTDAGSVPPKGEAATLPSGVFEMEITKDEVGAQNQGFADERWLGSTRIELDGDTFRLTYADGFVYEADLLWGKPDRLIVRARGTLGNDFTGQCPRYESWRWALRGDALVLSDPSPERNCNDTRNQLSFEPLVRIG